MASFAAQMADRLLKTANQSQDPVKLVKPFAEYLKKRNLVWVMPAVLRHLKNKQAIMAADQTLIITAKNQPDETLVAQIKAALQVDAITPMVFKQDDNVLSGVEVRYSGKAYVATAASRLKELTSLLQTSK